MHSFVKHIHSFSHTWSQETDKSYFPALLTFYHSFSSLLFLSLFDKKGSPHEVSSTGSLIQLSWCPSVLCLSLHFPGVSVFPACWSPGCSEAGIDSSQLTLASLCLPFIHFWTVALSSSQHRVRKEENENESLETCKACPVFFTGHDKPFSLGMRSKWSLTSFSEN